MAEQRLRRAALYMAGAIAAFSSMAVAGRAAALELDTFELMAWRSVIGIGLVLAIGGAAGTLGGIRARRMGLHAARNLSHFTGQNLWFFAITAIPLAQVFAIEFTSPIWVALAAPLLLGERLTRTRLVAACLGFAGVLIVARPGLEPVGPGQMAAAAAAVGFAGSALLTKLLTRTETITAILFWLTAMQAVMGIACAAADGDVAWPSATTLPWVALIACAGLAAHYCLTRALQCAPATMVVPMDFLRLPVIAVVGMAVYGEPLEAAVFVGAGVILAANLLNLRQGARAAPAGPAGGVMQTRRRRGIGS